MRIFYKFRGVVASGVGVFRYDKYIPGAELNAETASFASFLNDVDDAVGHLDAVPIKRLSPINHDSSSISY